MLALLFVISVFLILAASIFGSIFFFREWILSRFPDKQTNDSDYQPPDGIERSLFLEWRSPRRGTVNPQEMTNEVWKWLVASGINAYWANRTFNGPSSMDAGPCWCFDRFGRSETVLPDGRTVYIGGEHEDRYDPDFYIYNDVVLIDAETNIHIFGYPTDVFPPTDFHTATLVGSDIILIGNLGYRDDRRPSQTQVLRLNIDTWSVSPMETSGDAPGWIHEHKAELTENQNEIRVFGGLVHRGNQTPLIENLDEWSLDLQTGQWKRLTQRRWPRFVLYRKDKKWNHLPELRNLIFWKQMAERDKQYDKNYNEAAKKLKKELRRPLDLKLLETLYVPDIATEIVPQNDSDDDDEHGVYRIRIGDVVVRYFEDMSCVTVTVEGELPPDTVERLKNDVMDKFTVLEGAPIICQTIPFE